MQEEMNEDRIDVAWLTEEEVGNFYLSKERKRRVVAARKASAERLRITDPNEWFDAATTSVQQAAIDEAVRTVARQVVVETLRQIAAELR
jgi:hypothetical protein